MMSCRGGSNTCWGLLAAGLQPGLSSVQFSVVSNLKHIQMWLKQPNSPNSASSCRPPFISPAASGAQALAPSLSSLSRAAGGSSPEPPAAAAPSGPRRPPAEPPTAAERSRRQPTTTTITATLTTNHTRTSGSSTETCINTSRHLPPSSSSSWFRCDPLHHVNTRYLTTFDF